MLRAASRGVLISLLEDEAADETISKVLAIPASIKRHTFYIVGSTGVASGAVTLETADDPDYAGDWAPLVNDLATPTSNPVTVVAEDQEIYSIEGSFAFLRARISTAIGSGTVSVSYMGK